MDKFFTQIVFKEIATRWPELDKYVVENAGTNGWGGLLDFLVATINMPDNRTVNFDSIIQHIMKNEDMISWWIL